MIKITKFNSLLFLLLAFMSAQIFTACQRTEEILEEQEATTISALAKPGGYPLFLAIDNERDLRGVSDFGQGDYEGHDISYANMTLATTDFSVFQQHYGLGEYDRILTTYLLVDAPEGYLNYTVSHEQIQRILVYYIDAKGGAALDIIEEDKTVASYSNLSTIYGSVTSALLLSDIAERTNPLDLEVASTIPLTDAHWVLQSEDELKLQYRDPTKEPQISGGGDICIYNCSSFNRTDECSKWNPNKCGDICEMRSTQIRLSEDSETEGLARDFEAQFPAYYELRDALRKYPLGEDLVYSVYDIGQLTFTGQVKMSLGVRLEAVGVMLSNQGKIAQFLAEPESAAVLYTKEEAQTYFNLINNLKLQSDHAGYQGILKDFESYLYTFQDTPIRDIYEKLK